MQMSKTEHLAWAKQRALETLEHYRNSALAFVSLTSDLKKHPELSNHAGIALGTNMLAIGQLTTVAAMRKFIEDFS